jgi:hypothetical protein
MIVFMCRLHQSVCVIEASAPSVIGWSNPDDRKDRDCGAEISSDAYAIVTVV